VFTALIADAPSATRFRPLGVFRGHGCHSTPEIAVIRAVTEAVQSRLTYISGSRDDLFPERYRALQRKEAKGLHRADLEPGCRHFRRTRNVSRSTLDAELTACVATLADAGLREVAVFDLTRPGLGVPAVKALVPGLENNLHAGAGYKPGARATRNKMAAA
jgi:ribosomal protein S12 methylthiotransferase accessory factor